MNFRHYPYQRPVLTPPSATYVLDGHLNIKNLMTQETEWSVWTADTLFSSATVLCTFAITSSHDRVSVWSYFSMGEREEKWRGHSGAAVSKCLRMKIDLQKCQLRHLCFVLIHKGSFTFHLNALLAVGFLGGNGLRFACQNSVHISGYCLEFGYNNVQETMK